mmetsp:Transcript_21885/g.60753  ORF Transcript_21885/g.60753 Transcript_21885/m.60753 type:complete len:416 (-) Transcript_21885:48-1295(-)
MGEHEPRDAAKPLLIGVDGQWYDVSNFVSKHPGGKVILEYVGRDASAIFHAYHDASRVLKLRKPVGTYQMKTSKLDKDYLLLEQQLRDEGYFDLSDGKQWAAMQAARAVLVLACIGALMPFAKNVLVLIAQAFLLAFFWHQTGGMMHDSCHNNITTDRKFNYWMSILFGTVGFGTPASWWKDEHTEHHVFTNSFEPGVGQTDPQMQEDMWVQNHTALPHNSLKVPPFLIRLQHYYALPLMVVFGRPYILIKSFTETYRYMPTRNTEWAFVGVHWAWMVLLLLQAPSVPHGVAVWLMAAVLEGALHIQLTISHYPAPWASKEDLKNSFVKHQILHTGNIPWAVCLDFLGLGLQFHIEHHIFPKMPRASLRKVAPAVRKLCLSNDLPYTEFTIMEGIRQMVRELHKAAQLSTKLLKQ